MKLVKPNWVTHDGYPIFSIDIHPDGKRFATGGQGGDSGRVVIWNMEPVVSETAELDSNVPKMLCQLDNHLACVNCVRWSNSGLLASGGVDKLIMIWRLSGSGGSSIFGGKASVETWRCIATLRSHEADVLDLAWAPHSPWLASASVDNSVIVWDASKFPAVVAVLKGHTGFVKGITWDPVGKYLASQSDDKTLRVWRTTDWTEAALISEPFDECGGTTHVLRLSWSPDGQYLVSAHAMNGGGPTAQIIERDGWTQDKDFVGHRKAVTCVSSLHERLYGKPLVQGGCMVMEAPELLNLKQPASNQSSQVSVPSIPPVTNTATTPVKGPINKQIETRTSDGKRRITPMFIPPPADTTDTNITGTPTFTSKVQTKSSIVIEKRNDVVAPNVTSSVKPATVDTPGSSLTLKRKEQTTPRIHHSSPSKKPKFVSDRNTGQMLLPPLKPSSSLSQQAGHYAVTVTNSQGLAHLQVFKGTDSEPTWDIYLGYSAVALAASPAVIALGLEDGSLHTFHPAKGCRPAPPLAPPAPLAKVHAVGNAVMVISSCGAVRVWEIGNTCRMIVSTSAAHLAVPGTSLLSCTLYNGMPHVAFTNARAYIYHKDMGTWLLIGDSQDPVWRWSSFNVLSTSGNRAPRGPLSSLQEGLLRTAGNTLPNPRLPHSAPSVVSYLEQQLLASKALGSAQEYVHWLMALVSFLLTQDGLEKRLRLILDDLLGPSHTSASKSVWDPVILGNKKHKLLGDVLAVVGGHLRWQRLYLEYSEQLTTLKNQIN
ncbi:protein HIRA [Pogonomyrmex barbatus]|uniref:Protein HIRA n=1 Tax=Pogonomyrmex barbatus TaxID=144034 RepID=A0A6I9VSE0_9HYME|nr:protein HIRA [Pogonomyrmex barbatus]